MARNTAAKDISIGIDLGTTNSCIAYVQNGVPKIIPNEGFGNTMPSVVTIQQDGTRIVGKNTQIQTSNVKNTIYESKRLIGRRFSDTCVQERILHWPFKVKRSDREGSPVICVSLSVPERHKKYFFPEEISGMILGKLTKIAEDYLKCTVNNAVITVPANFNDHQRQATIDAAKIARFNVLKIINEPTAAALAFIVKHEISEPCTTVVFDLGGGTLDVSIIKWDTKEFNVIAVNGDPDLGGADFDTILYNEIMSLIKKQFSLKFNPVQIRRLYAQCIKVKEQLSETHEATFELLNLDNENDFEYIITRSQFESLINQMIKKIIAIVNVTLKEANLTVSDIDNIVLVGGSTRIPIIQKKLEELFKKPLSFAINPDEAVACGAALQAAKLQNEEGPVLRNVLLIDVTPSALGVEAEGKYMDVIIKKNTPLPATFKKMYTTAFDNQTALRINIYQGDGNMTSSNTKLGEFDLFGIPPAPARVPQIWVIFDMDSNSILRVTAIETSSNQEIHMQIKSNTGRISQDDFIRIERENELYVQQEKFRQSCQDNIHSLLKKCFIKKRHINQLKVNIHVKKELVKDLNTLIKYLESLSVDDEAIVSKIKHANEVYDTISESLTT